MLRGPRLGWAVVGLTVACAGPQADPPSDSPPGASSAGAALVDASPPARNGAFAPWLTSTGEALQLSWLEPLPGEEGHRFVVSRRDEAGWSEPVEISRGTEFFANWADVPGIGRAGDGALVAHWLEKSGEGTYAYSVALARSEDGGASWRPLGWLHDDATETEHGFVSWAPEGDAARAVWLDGREMADGGAMTLRTALVGVTVGSATVLDDRVCECCPTDLAATSKGPLVVYRDRSDDEIRDIGRAWAAAGAGPSSGSGLGPMHADGWAIPGCPVNGPRIDSLGERTAVAWFTAANNQPQILAAFSEDGGETFADPVRFDEGLALGRVDLRLAPDGSAVAVWLEAAGEHAVISMRRIATDGALGEVRPIAETGSARASGIPRLARFGDSWYVAWVETVEGRPTGVRVTRVAETAI